MKKLGKTTLKKEQNWQNHQNQLSKWLKEAEIPDADESLLPMSDDEIYIIKNHSFFTVHF